MRSQTLLKPLNPALRMRDNLQHLLKKPQTFHGRHPIQQPIQQPQPMPQTNPVDPNAVDPNTQVDQTAEGVNMPLSPVNPATGERVALPEGSAGRSEPNIQ